MSDSGLAWQQVRLLTIVAERLLRDRILRHLDQMSVSGYTVIDSEGRGSRGVMVDEWQGDNVEIQILASIEVVDRIAEKMRERYFEHYSIILFAQNVDVLRGDKYKRP